MGNEIEKYTETLFDKIKHVNEYGQEVWYARELAKILEYTEYNKFLPVVKKAIQACEKSHNEVQEHFEEILEMIIVGNVLSESFRAMNYLDMLVILS